MKNKKVTLKALKLYHGFNKKYFPIKFLSLLFSEISPYYNLWMSAEIVTALYDNKEQSFVFRLIFLTVTGNFIIHILSAWLNRIADTEYKVLIDNESRALNNKTLSLDYIKLEDPEIRTLRRKITENSYINGYGIDALRQNLEFTFKHCISLLFAFIFFSEILVDVLKVGFKPGTFIFFCLIIFFMVFTISFYQKFSLKRMTSRDKAIGELMLKENRFGQGYRLNGMDSRIYKQQDIVTEIETKMNKEHLRLFVWTRNQAMLANTPYVFFSNIPEVFVYLLVCFYALEGVFSIGGIIKYIGYLRNIIDHTLNLFYYYNSLKSNEPFLVPYIEYFELKNDMYQGSLTTEKRSDKKFDIEFKNVSFKYPGSDAYAVKNLNLRLKVGQKLAVVGMNGSGKTTFIKLLTRLYDPTDGDIIMNDFNVRKYDYREYLDLFSVVFQDYSLLSVPLGNNIAACDKWDKEKCERLIKEVGFFERYKEMQDKLETPIYKDFDDKGVLLSGGEAQKIALARALYKDAPFIILDEPTAALDPIAEAEIYSKFDSIVGDKTAIYISHRLSSCRFCDKIAVFDKGEIVQYGSHEELLKDKNGKYHELWYAQANYYNK